MKMAKKIPLGLSSYKEIITEGYYYVDKTRYIEVLEGLNTKYPILLRPRRFGKTLFADTLQTYYDLKEKDNFDRLFGETYIGQHKTELANSYYVLHLNLSGLDTRDADRLEKTFGAYIKSEVHAFLVYYGISDIILEEEDLVTYMNHFLSELRRYGLKNLYIIIDEYDHFANSLLSSKESFSWATSKDGFIRSFYEVLKKHTKDVIERIFITGVTSLTLDSLTSGFNICKNVSQNKELNGVVGFTSAEVEDFIDYMKIPDKENTLEVLKENYNGYIFSRAADEKVYNSNMITYYMDEYVENGRQPDELADPNITGDYAKLSSMFDLYTDAVRKEDVLQKLMANETVTGHLMTSFGLLTRFTYDHFLSLLYYLGLLTIEKDMSDGNYQFRAPNQVIRAIYYDYYFTYLTDTLDLADHIIMDALLALEDHADVSLLTQMVEQIIADSTKNNKRYMIHFRENTLQMLFYLILRKSERYKAKMEYAAGKRFIDILYVPVEGGTQYALELKYISQARFDEDNQVLDEKIEALNEQMAADLSLSLQTRGIGIVFVGGSCRYQKIYGGSLDEKK